MAAEGTFAQAANRATRANDLASDSELAVIELKGIEELAKNYVTVHGRLEDVDEFINNADAEGHLERNTADPLKGWYYGMGATMVRLRGGEDTAAYDAFLGYLIEYPKKISAHRTEWVFADPKKNTTNVECFVRKQHQGLSTHKPFKIIFEGFKKVCRPKIMHTRANSFTVEVPREKEAEVRRILCPYLDAHGIGMLINGRWVKTEARKKEDNRRFAQLALSEFGVTGLDPTYTNLVLQVALKELKLENPAAVGAVAQWTLKEKGQTPYKLTGLTGEEKQSLDGKSYRITQSNGAKIVRFGYLCHLVNQEVIRDVAGSDFE
eukprot:gene23871-10023_t